MATHITFYQFTFHSPCGHEWTWDHSVSLGADDAARQRTQDAYKAAKVCPTCGTTAATVTRQCVGVGSAR